MANTKPRTNIIAQIISEKLPIMLYKSGGRSISPEPKIGPMIRPDKVKVFSFLLLLFILLFHFFLFKNCNVVQYFNSNYS